MSKLRYLYNNAINRATLTVPGTAAGMGAENMRTDVRGQVTRVVGTSMTITAVFPGLEMMGLVAIPASNLAPGSTIRVRTYSNTAATTLTEDTGVVAAYVGDTTLTWWPGVSSVNAFTDGSQPMVLVYLPTRHSARSMVVNITNPNGTFIDISRIVAGGYNETTYTADWGASVGTTDMSTNTRTAAGDLRTDWAPRYDTLQFDLTGLTESERAPMRHVISGGVGQWLLFDLLAENPDPTLARAFSIYGKLSQSAAMSYRAFRSHATQIQIEGFAAYNSALVTAVDPGTAPINITLPVISGIAQVGQTLTAGPGTWTGMEPVNITAPSISGIAQVGNTLTANDGVWSNL